MVFLVSEYNLYNHKLTKGVKSKYVHIPELHY